MRRLIQYGRTESEDRQNHDKPIIAIVLQGLMVGGMERGAIQLARCAIGSGYDARLVLYDQPYNGSDSEYNIGDIPVAFVPRARGIDFGLPRKLASLFRQWEIAIVQARGNVAGFYSAAAITAMGRRAPKLVISFHTLPVGGTAKARLSSRWASRRAARVTSVSEELARRLVTSGWVTASEVIWNGVDTAQFSPNGHKYGLKRQLGLHEETLLIGIVARIEQNKRQGDLLEAVQRLRQNHHEVALVMAGDGPDRSEIEGRAAAMGGVSMIRRVVDVAAFLRDLDVFVLCSAHEGSPRALLEAMSCGKAIVATEVGGIPDMLNGCGLLVPSARPDLLAQAIEQFLVDSALRAHLGDLARQRAQALFSMEREWTEYERLYKSVLRNDALT